VKYAFICPSVVVLRESNTNNSNNNSTNRKVALNTDSKNVDLKRRRN
jgi:hypothetical protein